MIQVISGTRRSGKTTKMVKWLQENSPRILLVPTEMQERRLKRTYPELKDQIMTWTHWQACCLPDPTIEIGVDDAECLLTEYFHHRISILSISTDEE